MPLWLGGNTWIVATGWGIARWDGTKYEIYRYPRAGSAADPPGLDVLAVATDDGTRAVVRRQGEAPALWRIGEAGGEVVACACPPIVAAIGLGGGQLLAVTEDGGRAVL